MKKHHPQQLRRFFLPANSTRDASFVRGFAGAYDCDGARGAPQDACRKAERAASTAHHQ